MCYTSVWSWVWKAEYMLVKCIALAAGRVEYFAQGHTNSADCPSKRRITESKSTCWYLISPNAMCSWQLSVKTSVICCLRDILSNSLSFFPSILHFCPVSHVPELGLKESIKVEKIFLLQITTNCPLFIKQKKLRAGAGQWTGPS